MSNPYIEARPTVAKMANKRTEQLRQEYSEAEAALKNINAKSTQEEFEEAQLQFRKAANALGYPTSEINKKIGEALIKIQEKS